MLTKQTQDNETANELLSCDNCHNPKTITVTIHNFQRSHKNMKKKKYNYWSKDIMINDT
jgi:hypothetical protein